MLAIGELSQHLFKELKLDKPADFNIEFVTAEEAVALLTVSEFAAIFISYTVLQTEKVKFISRLRALNALVPLMIVADQKIDSDMEVAVYEAGAIDIISTKISDRILTAKIRYCLDLQMAQVEQLALQVGLSAANRAIEKNEEKLKFALSSAKMGTWTVGLPSGYVTLSEEARALFGFSKTYDHSDHAIDEFIHPDYRQQARTVLAQAISTGSFYNDEYQIIRPDGEIRWINARGRARYDAEGNPYQLSGLIWDITDRKTAEIGLKTLETRFSRSADATDLGVWYCNLPFDVLIWNKEVKGHFFLPPDAHVTIHTFYEIIHPEDREPTRKAIEASIAGKASYDMIYRTVDPNDDENIKHIRAMGWTDYNEAGDPIRFDGITLDVSDQHKYQEELRSAKIAAEKANELKSAFLANMSHEIRTPLGAMIGFADLLKETGLSDEERLTYANVITRNGLQLSHIINDILDISKVESGQFSVESLEINPTSIAEDVLSLLSLSATEKGIELNLKVDENTPENFVTDPLRLKQIITNIVGNAIKFTSKGHVNVSLFCGRGASECPELNVRVEDTGDGIASKDQKKLFQVFSQADDSVTRKFGGTGLGLALSRKLARALGGDVILERSEKGAGSTFLVTVAAGKPQDVTSYVFADAARSDTSLPTYIEGVKILLVEDTPDNQELISTVLEERKVTVDIAKNGLEGIEKALAGDHDMVLMDLQMPVMDGYTATQTLRERGFDKPIIALSAHAMNEVRLEVLNVGCTDYLTKPINFTELIQVVGRYAGRNL